MIAWLFWSSLVLLIYAGGCWLIARHFPEAALGIAKLGDMAPGLPEPRGWAADEEIVATPPRFLLRTHYPEDGC